VRSGHDKLYVSLSGQWGVERLASVDRSKGVDGKLDPSIRQRGVDGGLLQTRALDAQLVSSSLRLIATQPVNQALEELLRKLQMQQQQQQRQQEDSTSTGQVGLPPPQQRHDRQQHPGRTSAPLSLASLWAITVAATDELYSIAEKLHPKLETGIRGLCEEAKIECKLEFAPLKDPVRVFEKALDDYWDRFADSVPATACVSDIVRCRFLCPSLEACANVAQVLIEGAPAWLELIRVKNKFRELDSAHFRNMLFNFRVHFCGGCGALRDSAVLEHGCSCDNKDQQERQQGGEGGGCRLTSHIFEIQVHHEQILGLSEKMHSHMYYEFFRTKNDTIKPEELDFMIDNQLQFFAEIRSSPVLLSLLILILDVGDYCQFPSSVYQLYEMAIKASIKRFVEERPHLLDNSSSSATKDMKAEVLRVVQKIGHRNHVAQRRAFEHLAPTDPDYGLWNEICATGIYGTATTTVLSFVKVIARMELYQFSHLSFQEFLYVREAKHLESKNIEGDFPPSMMLDFHSMVKDGWNYNALRIGVSHAELNNAMLLNGHDGDMSSNSQKAKKKKARFEWRDIRGENVELCQQLLRVNSTVQELVLDNGQLTALPQVNNQVECLSVRANPLLAFHSPMSSGLVGCKLKTLELTGSLAGGVEHMVDALRGNSNLQFLHLADNGNSIKDASVVASLFASNPALVAITLPLSSLEAATTLCEVARAVQNNSSPGSMTVLVMSRAVVPSDALEAMRVDPKLHMWDYAQNAISSSLYQAQEVKINDALASYVEALPLSGDLICVAPTLESRDREIQKSEGPITFISAVFAADEFAMISLTAAACNNLDLRGFRVGVKSLPQLMLYARNFSAMTLKLADTSALECLVALVITHPAARKLAITAVCPAEHFDPGFLDEYRIDSVGLFSFEEYRLREAAKLWGVTIQEEEEEGMKKPPMFTFKHIAPLMIAAIVAAPFWITLAGHVVFGKHKWLVKDNLRINQSVYGTRPFNLWNLLTFSWIQFGFAWLPINDTSVRIHVYVILLVLVLLHNLGENEVIPRERRLSASVFTWFELSSYFVHLVTICQLLLLMFFFAFTSQGFEAVFTIFLMRVPTNIWPVATSAVALFGAIPVILREIRVFKAPEVFYLFREISEIPIIFNVLEHGREGLEQERAICFMALFAC